MLAIDDQAIIGGRRFERGGDRPRLAAAERTHGVEQMGEAGQPFAHRRARLRIGRHRMAERDLAAGGDERSDEALAAPPPARA